MTNCRARPPPRAFHSRIAGHSLTKSVQHGAARFISFSLGIVSTFLLNSHGGRLCAHSEHQGRPGSEDPSGHHYVCPALQISAPLSERLTVAISPHGCRLDNDVRLGKGFDAWILNQRHPQKQKAQPKVVAQPSNVRRTVAPCEQVSLCGVYRILPRHRVTPKSASAFRPPSSSRKRPLKTNFTTIQSESAGYSSMPPSRISACGCAVGDFA